MTLRNKRFFQPPVFVDEDKNRIAGLANSILLILIAGAFLFFLSANFAVAASKMIRTISLIMIFITVGLKILLNQGYLIITSIAISASAWGSFSILIYSFDGIRDTAITGYFLAAVITGMLLSTELLAFFTVLGSLSFGFVYWAEMSGATTTSIDHLPSLVDVVNSILTLNITAILTGFTVRQMKLGDKATREERNKAQEYLNIAGSIIIAMDTEQKITLINKMGSDVLGYSENELLGKDWVTHFLPESTRKETKEYLTRYMKGEVELAQRQEILITTKTKGKRRIAWRHTRLQDHQGAVVGLLSSGEDITERLETARELEKRRLYLESVLSAAPDAIVTLNARHLISEWNRGAEKLFGYSASEVIGKNLDNLIATQEVIDEATNLTKLAMKGQEISPMETIRYKKDRSPVNVILAGSPILVGEEHLGAVAIYTDISERKKMEKELTHLATHDPLTNLPNRTLLQDRLQHALRRATRQKDSRRTDKWEIAILMVDLNSFKKINDTFGHSVGDLLLKSVGKRLKNAVRKSDTVARIGGDEFTIIFENISQERDPLILANKVLNSFNQPFLINAHSISITASIGVSFYPKDGEDFETLFIAADKSMYKSKRNKNTYQSSLTIK